MTTALLLRVCGPKGESYGGFRWPLKVGAEVIAPDWSPVAECGNGLHGWLYGQGDITVAEIGDKSRWLVVETDESSIVMLGGKCKFPKCVVRFVGKMHEAAAYIIEHEACAKSVAVIGATLAVGEGESCMVGASGTATAGYRGTATAGYSGTATAGDSGTATAGDRGTATAGYSGTATAGDRGTATAGDSGTATAGYRGTATAGDYGTATAGDYGTIVVTWYDAKVSRYRRTIGYVGEEGVEANVAYRCDERGKLIRA